MYKHKHAQHKLSGKIAYLLQTFAVLFHYFLDEDHYNWSVKRQETGNHKVLSEWKPPFTFINIKGTAKLIGITVIGNAL
jgi:hypothetical protein